MSSFVPGGLKVTLMPDMALVGRNARGYRGMSFTDAKGQNYVIWRYRVVSNAAGSHQMLAVVGPYTGGYTEDLSVGTDQYTLKENEYLLQATIKNDCATDQVESFPAFFSRTSGTSGNFDWLSFDTNTSDAQRYIEFEFSKDKPAPMISCTLGVYPPNGTAGKRTNEFLQLRGRQVSFTNGTMSGSTMMITVSADSPVYEYFTMDISHLDETTGITYTTLSATGSEAQKADVDAGVQESKDYTDEKISELLDSLYPPEEGTASLTVYASGNKTWWHLNSLEIYLISGQRLYPLYYESTNSGSGTKQIKLIFTSHSSASMSYQPSTFFDSYELKECEYSGTLLFAEYFGQTTTQANNYNSNIFSTDNHGLYVAPLSTGEAAAFGIQITGKLQRIAKISLRSPRQASYVPLKLKATYAFGDTSLDSPEIETNSDTSSTFVLPFAEESESEDIDLSNYVTLDGAESITGVKTFAATPVITNAPAGDTDAVNKAYVDKAIQDAALEGEEIDTSKLVTTDTAQSITGAKSFTAPVTVATPTADEHAATKAYVDQALEGALEEGGAIDDAINDAINDAVGDTSNFVTLNGAQTITGVKTFSAAPIITNAPAADNEAANKAYVDSLLSSSGGGDSCTAENMYAASLGEMFDRVGYKNRFIISNICSRPNSSSAYSGKYFMISNAYLTQYTDKDQSYPKFQVLRKTPCSVIPAERPPYIFDSASAGFYYTQYFVARTNNVPDQSVSAPASPAEITQFSEKNLFDYICSNSSAPKITYQQGAYTNTLGFTDDNAIVFRVMVRNLLVTQLESVKSIDLSAMFCKYGAFSTSRPFCFRFADFSSGQDLQNGSTIKDDSSLPHQVSNLSAIYIDILKYQSQNSSNSRYDSIQPVYRFGCNLYSAYSIASGSANTSSFKADICGVFGDSFASKTVDLVAKDISGKATLDSNGLLNMSNYGQTLADISAYSVKNTSSYLWNLVGLKNRVDDLETRLKALESS